VMRTACLLLVAATVVLAHGDHPPKKVTLLLGNSSTSMAAQAIAAFKTADPGIDHHATFQVICEATLADTPVEDLASSDILIIDIMTHNLDRQPEQAKRTGAVKGVIARGGTVLAINESSTPRETYEAMGVTFDAVVREYWQKQGWRNLEHLLMYVVGKYAGDPDQRPDPPEDNLKFGYYTPTEDGGKTFADFDAYAAFLRERGEITEGAPWVALLSFSSFFYNGEAGIEDHLVGRLRKEGLNVLCGFGYPEAIAAKKLLLDAEGRPRVDVAISFLFRFSGFDAAQTLAEIDVPVINLISTYGRTEEEWRSSKQGLSVFEGVFNVAIPEVAGLVQPTVVGVEERTKDPRTGFPIIHRRPIEERAGRVVDRVKKWIALRRTPNAQKRIAVLYYNYPPGKSNVGASYLNVPRTLSQLLGKLKAEGYDIGEGPIDPDAILSALQASGRNVGSWAPGELDALVASGGCTLIPVEEYETWFARFPDEFRAAVTRDWGPPEKNTLMTWKDPASGKTSIVLPTLRRGNVVLLAQPVRGWGDNLEKLYHSTTLAPHHQYVAAYAWIRHGFQANAVVHVGTHGTHEWLSGKDAGLGPEDAPEALIFDLPNVYPYNVDVVGEGLVAKRRGMAIIVDHMIPPLRPSGLYHEYAELQELVNDHDANLGKSPELAEAFKEELRAKVVAMGLHKDLGMAIEAPGSMTHEQIHEVEEHVRRIKEANMPYGLHTFGVAPQPDLRALTIEVILAVDRGLDPEKRKAFAADLDRRMVEGASQELDSFARALAGRFVMTGTGNDPVRNPDSLPTGRNFFGIDPTKVPKKAAWSIGVKLADQMLAEHRAKHGAYPRKLSFVIWGGETLRHEGVLESEMFYLLGTRPVWDERGKVVGVEVIPSAELGRPRIDCVVSCAAEGMFAQLTVFLDQAVQMVRKLDEKDNLVREHILEAARQLEALGHPPDKALALAAVRIFDEPPGEFNLNIAKIARTSGTWDDPQVMADDYLSKLCHGYGNGFWGERMEDAYRLAISGTEIVVHSRSSQLYGALDNDDVFMYVGGLAHAIKSIDGKTPDVMESNLSDPSRPEAIGIEKLLGREFRSRYANPKWIEGMKKEDYAGARTMEDFFENLWGWEAVMPDVIDDAKWDEAYEVYVKDKYALGMREFFDKANPHARQAIVARLLETVRKKGWNPKDPKAVETLAKEYVESVVEVGAACCEHTCNNPYLDKLAIATLSMPGLIDPQVLAKFQRVMEQVRKKALDEATRQMDRLKRDVAQRKAAEKAKAPGKPPVKGYEMQDMSKAPPTSSGGASGGIQWVGIGLAVGIVGLLCIGFRRGHRGA